MQTPNPTEVGALRALIEEFLQQQRLAPKLEAIDKQLDKTESEQERAELQDRRAQLIAAHAREAWLEDAARRAGQIQLVTHAIKFSHPNARGSNLYLYAPSLSAEADLVGTHSLGTNRADDVVGNAAALDVYKLLALEHAGETLLQRLLRADPALDAAMSDQPEQAAAWRQGFCAITAGDAAPASHTLARQVYFPLEEPGAYHLLAPLFPTSLVHEVHGRLREARFGDAAKAAHEARKKGAPHPHGYHDYPQLVTLIYGGSKPQNISQLNSQRYGENWLLPSCPPVWQSPAIRPPFGVRSVFRRVFPNRPAVRELTRALADFLKGTDYNNVHIREARARRVEQVRDELVGYAAELHQLDPGWSAAPACQLDPDEALWLDPGRATDDPAFAAKLEAGAWREEIASRFARWLNDRLRRDKLPVGDPEQQEWERLVAADLEELSHV